MTPIQHPQAGWQKWLLGALFTLVLMFGSFAFSGDHERIDKVEAAVNSATTIIAVQENESKHMQEQLDRIEKKLDTLILLKAK